ncbi:MAG: ribbon-helix-helix protein, CopG family [Clostridia bacterium]|nr:ribbon-helix-helix protein, CopG family [Clostridia bacterium]
MKQEKLIIHPKRPKGEDGYKTFSIRIADELVEKINAISAQTGHSRNELIGIFLAYAVEHCSVAEN